MVLATGNVERDCENKRTRNTHTEDTETRPVRKLMCHKPALQTEKSRHTQFTVHYNNYNLGNELS